MKILLERKKFRNFEILYSHESCLHFSFDYSYQPAVLNLDLNVSASKQSSKLIKSGKNTGNLGKTVPNPHSTLNNYASTHTPPWLSNMAVGE